MACRPQWRRMAGRDRVVHQGARPLLVAAADGTPAVVADYLVGTDHRAACGSGRCAAPSAARALWLVLRGSLVWLSLWPVGPSPRGLNSAISGMAVGAGPGVDDDGSEGEALGRPKLPAAPSGAVTQRSRPGPSLTVRRACRGRSRSGEDFLSI